jgi:hypothetical protein
MRFQQRIFPTKNDALHHSKLIYVAANISLVGHVGRAYAAIEVAL